MGGFTKTGTSELNLKGASRQAEIFHICNRDRNNRTCVILGVVRPKSTWDSSVQEELIGSGPLRNRALMLLLGPAHCLGAPDRKGQKQLQRHWTSELNTVLHAGCVDSSF